MDWLDYREKLKIGFSDEAKFVLLKTKVFNVLNIVQIHLSGLEYVSFCNMIGRPIKPKLVVGQEYPNRDTERYDHCIELIRDCSGTLCDFLSAMVAFINTLGERPEPQFGKSSCISMLQTMMDESHVLYETHEDDNGYFVFPKGVEELDEALISQPLEWLKNYPDTEKAWSKSLREYAESNDHNASDIADKMRKSLELFFKEFFENNKTLENNKVEYGRYLKAQGVPAEISNNLETLLLAYTNFMNAYAKHHDKTEPKVLEYLMYQTGNIMRLLIILKAEETANAD